MNLSDVAACGRLGRRFALCVLCVGVLATLSDSKNVVAQTVSISSNVVGQTPSVIGLNSGNYLQGANTTSFWRWTGVNGARIFTSAPNIEQDDDIPGNGDGVNSESLFLFRRDLLRADPTNPDLINFAEFEDGYQNNQSDFINYDFAYGEFAANGIKQLAIINRTFTRYPFAANGTADGWADRWEHWQHYYAQAYYLGSNHGVERFSMYNEPDQFNQDVTRNVPQADYLNRLQLASDAIQSALEDVNRDFETNLQPNILAPITAGGSNEYFRRLDNSDTRDDIQGWGELVINSLNTNFLGQVDPSFQLIHTYAYQQYNVDGSRYADDLDDIQRWTAEDIADNNLVGNVNFGLTEFNVHSNGVFTDRSDDLNTPSRYARLGGIFTGLTNQQADELFLFKFSSNAEDDFLQKNAIFANSRFDAPYNVGGATSAAGVLKLFTKGFVGGQDLLQETSHGVNKLDVASSYNQSTDTYYVLAANESNGSDRSLTFNFSSLGIPAGVIVQVEEVSEGNLAEVTDRIPLPANGQIDVVLDRESVMLLSIPRTAPEAVLELAPTDDATVRAGNNSDNNFGGSSNVFVRNVTAGPDGRSVGLLQFDASQVGGATVKRAVLQVHGDIDEGNPEFVTTHVFVIRGDQWDEDSIVWDNVNNLSDTQGSVTNIADNFVTGVSDSADFVGHLTFSQSYEPVSVDITEFVTDNLENGQLRFLIAREVRFDAELEGEDGENVDRSVGAVRFDSKENSSTNGPRLILELSDLDPVAMSGDFDMDGDVDAEDIDFYSGETGNVPAAGALAQLDLTGDGVITLADYDFHIENLVQTSNGQVGTFVGDINLDGTVNVLGDAFALIGSLGASDVGYAQGDLNADGDVNVLNDAFRLIGNIGNTNE